MVPNVQCFTQFTTFLVCWCWWGQWREFQSFDIKWSALTLTKIHRFYFKDIRFSIKLWSQSFKYLKSISQSGNCLVNCHGDQLYSWFSATNWLSRTLIGQFIFETAHLAHHHPPSWSRWPRFTFFSINDFTSKFIEINGNPSLFYVIDCYRRHYDTQIIEIIEITNKITIYMSPRHQPLKNLHFTHPCPNPSLQTHSFY